MKQIIILYLVLVAAMFLAYSLSNPDTTILSKFLSGARPQQTQEVKKIAKVGNAQIEVEIAKTQEQRRMGLSSRDRLDEGKGMLFVFEEKSVKPVFWMKDMKFPIDIAWISKGKVVEITANVPVAPALTPEDKLPRYSPLQAIDYVLEIGAGQAAKRGIKVGDGVELPQL